MSDYGTEYNVLFLSNSNSARSIMAEAILDREGRGKFRAHSAGIQAHAEVDRHAADLLKKMHFDVDALHPKDWSALADEDGLTFDFVFTLCESATLLPHAMWRGNPVFAHWGVANPAFAAGNEAEVRLAYADAFRMLSNRIGIFVNLPLRSLDLFSMQRKLDVIGGQQAAAVAVA
jgi:protein-tyrosine-phosphatase